MNKTPRKSDDHKSSNVALPTIPHVSLRHAELSSLGSIDDGENGCFVEHTRTFLWGPFSSKVTIQLGFEPESINLAEVLRLLFVNTPSLLPDNLFSLNTLTNMRGRPLEAFSDNGEHKLAPGEEELFYMRGFFHTAPSPAENDRQNQLNMTEDEALEHGSELSQYFSQIAVEDNRSPSPVPFSLVITSKFEDFPTQSSILHHLTWRYLGPMEKEMRTLSVSSMLKLLPISISEVRIGVECFQSKFIGQWFGMSPDITKRFYLEMCQENVSITILEERLSSKSIMPFSEINLTETVLQAFRSQGLSCSMNIIS